MRNKSGFLLEALILVGVLAFIIYIGNAYLKSLVKESKEIEMKKNYSLEVADGSQSIVLAGGCFWGTEHYLAQLPGVTRTFVSYANGNKENPTYQEVCTGTTGHAEAVFVEYNPKRISLHYLLTYFFKTINPTSYHKQGNDVGSQYRSGIYFTNSKDREVIERFVQEEQKKYQKSIVTEVLPLTSIYPAEEYHQKYLVKNPNGYCHVSFDSLPPADAKLTDEKNPLWEYSLPTQEELEELSELSYRVTQEKATERPFTSEYDKEFRDGIYVDITNGQPLFSSEDKFDAGCGWPSFTKPLEDELIQEYLDKSHGMIRTEVTSKLSAAHLGHVFDDGPDGQLRYCINGASLRFVPKEKMQEEGYGYLLVLFE